MILSVLLAGYLPFQDDNLVTMYMKIYKGDFKCPQWFLPESRRLITKLLDPNPSTRITTSKIMDSLWVKKSIPKVIRLKEEEDYGGKGKEIETLNAFHIISLSEGFNQSPLFEEKKREEREDQTFATTGPTASSVVLRLVISLSEGFNQSLLFEEKKREEREDPRFTMTGPMASGVVSRLEEAAVKAGKFSVRN